jgi:hypothetical protein
MLHQQEGRMHVGKAIFARNTNGRHSRQRLRARPVVSPGYGNVDRGADPAVSQLATEFFDQELTVAPGRNAQRPLDIEPRQSWEPRRTQR